MHEHAIPENSPLITRPARTRPIVESIDVGLVDDVAVGHVHHVSLNDAA